VFPADLDRLIKWDPVVQIFAKDVQGEPFEALLVSLVFCSVSDRLSDPAR